MEVARILKSLEENDYLPATSRVFSGAITNLLDRINKASKCKILEPHLEHEDRI